MRATRIIYRRELGAYLRSPFAWVLSALLLLVAGVFFQAYALAGDMLSAIVLERYFFIMCGVAIAAGLLLSFRLISEERQTHSLILLNTSPIRDTEIVVGKFLAALTFLAVLLVLSIYMPLLIKVNGKITSAQILVGYIGLFLVGSATLAIGTFASALANNQLIAGVVSLVIIILLLVMNLFGAKLDGVVRTVVMDLDLRRTHFDPSFQRGILNLKDIIFYLAMTYFFLLLAVKTMEAKRWQ